MSFYITKLIYIKINHKFPWLIKRHVYNLYLIKHVHLLIPTVFINLRGLGAEINEKLDLYHLQADRLRQVHEINHDSWTHHDRQTFIFHVNTCTYVKRMIACERHLCVKPIKCCTQTDIWQQRLCSPFRTQRSCTLSRCRCSRRESEEPSRWSDAADTQKEKNRRQSLTPHQTVPSHSVCFVSEAVCVCVGFVPVAGCDWWKWSARDVRWSVL